MYGTLQICHFIFSKASDLLGDILIKYWYLIILLSLLINSHIIMVCFINFINYFFIYKKRNINNTQYWRYCCPAGLFFAHTYAHTDLRLVWQVWNGFHLHKLQWFVLNDLNETALIRYKEAISSLIDEMSAVLPDGLHLTAFPSTALYVHLPHLIAAFTE